MGSDPTVPPGGVADPPRTTRSVLPRSRVTDRIFGLTRVGTAVAISRHAFPAGAPTAYLARSDVLADAVAAGSLTDGPVLLVAPRGPVPDAVTAEVTRLDPDRVTALGGPLAVASEVLLAVAGTRPVDCGRPFTTDRGRAATAAPVVGAALADGVVYVVTRGLQPAVLAAYDLSTRRIVGTTTLPTGQGSWAVTAVGRSLVVGTYLPADLYRVDRATLRPALASHLPSATYVFSATTAPDGVVFVGTLPDGAVVAYDPDTRRVDDLGVAVDGQYAVRSLAATETTVFAGVGARAHLVAIDRSSGDREQILPPTLDGESFVYTLAIGGRWLVAGTEPSGRVAILRIDDPGDARVLPDLGERTVDAIAVDGDTAWFTGRTSGTLYRYDIVTDELTPLAVPLRREETRAVFVVDDHVVGVGGTGVAWHYDLETGDVDRTDLAAVGLPPGPEPVQSLAAIGDTAAVGGHWSVQIHEPGRPVQRVRVPGEPKAAAAVDGALYLALYPSAELWRLDVAATDVDHVATSGDGQARPRRMAVDPDGRRVLVTSQADYGMRGGALWIHEPATRRFRVHRDVVAGHGLAGVGATATTAYVGSDVRSGGGLPPVGGSAHLVAWDLSTSAVVWDVVPVAGATAIIDVVAAHGLLYGLTIEGVALCVDPRTGDVLRTVRYGARGRALVTSRGLLFAVTSSGLHRVDLDTLAATAVLRGTDVTHVADGPGCTLFVVRGERLLHLNP